MVKRSDYLTQKDILKRYNIKRAWFYLKFRKKLKFPLPVGKYKRNLLWLKSSVEEWEENNLNLLAKETKKLPQIVFDD